MSIVLPEDCIGRIIRVLPVKTQIRCTLLCKEYFDSVVFRQIDEITVQTDTFGTLEILSRNCHKLTAVRKYVQMDDPSTPKGIEDLTRLCEAIFPLLTDISVSARFSSQTLRILNPNRLRRASAPRSLLWRPGAIGEIQGPDGPLPDPNRFGLLEMLSLQRFPRLESLDISSFHSSQCLSLLEHHASNFPALQELALNLPEGHRNQLAALMIPFEDEMIEEDPIAPEIRFNVFVTAIKSTPIKTLRLGGTKPFDSRGNMIPLKSVEEWRNAHMNVTEIFGLPCRSVFLGPGHVWDAVPRADFEADASAFDNVFEACYLSDCEKVDAMIRRMNNISRGSSSQWFVSQLDRILENTRGKLVDDPTMVKGLFRLISLLSGAVPTPAGFHGPAGPHDRFGRRATRYRARYDEQNPVRQVNGGPVTLNDDPEAQKLAEAEQKRLELLTTLTHMFDRILADVPFHTVVKYHETTDSLSFHPSFLATVSQFPGEYREKWGVVEALAAHRHVFSVLRLLPTSLLAEMISHPAFLRNELLTGGCESPVLIDGLKTSFFMLALAKHKACDFALDTLAQVAPRGVLCSPQFDIECLGFMLESPERATKCGEAFSDIGQLIHRATIGAELVTNGCSIANFRICLQSHFARFRKTGWSSEDETRLLDAVWMRTVFKPSNREETSTNAVAKWALEYSRGVPPEYLSIITAESSLVIDSFTLTNRLAALIQALPDDAPEKPILQKVHSKLTARMGSRGDFWAYRRRAMGMPI
eukprot:TRINITY_DN7187_c0_g1_i1.p1 TRINITY_DN7187_c0_g1~~TRINITY_DN7187_c0_g1_i1.p1  ORF type:complete len:757 (+),score=79.20 TRINITY_DN7187_c0_g1_i1:26-2296(+)